MWKRLKSCFIQGEHRYYKQVEKMSVTLDVINLKEKYVVRNFKQ